jgi:hypothetical protein
MAIADLSVSSFARRAISNIALGFILLVAAWVQFSVVARTEVNAPFSADAREHFFSAYNLVHHGVYSGDVTLPAAAHPPPEPDAVRSPGYPLFLASLGTPEPTTAFVRRITFAQATLGVLSVWLLFLISTRFLRPGWSHVAALLAAISPHLAVMSTYVLSETLFTFLLFASTYCSIAALRRPRVGLFLLAGVLWGLCSLVRPTTQLLPILALAGTVAVPILRPYLRSTAVMFAGFLLVISPWFIRNQLIAHNPDKTSLMVNFVLHGSYPGFMYNDNPATYGDPYRHDPDSEAAARTLPKTIAYIATRAQAAPLKYVSWYLIGKPGFLLSWTNIDGVGDIFVYEVARSPYLEDRTFDRLRYTMYWLHWPLMLLGLTGIVLLWLRAERSGLHEEQLQAARVASLIVLYAIGLHMIGAPYPRYGIPFRPLLYPLALFAIWLVVSRLLRIGTWRARKPDVVCHFVTLPGP